MEILSLDAGAVREVKPNLESVLGARPVWSPDGAFLVVSGSDANGRQGLWRVDAVTAETTPLVLNGVMIARGLSGDGLTLYIRKADARSAMLVARDLRSGLEREILRRDRLGDTALSPDGRYFAVAAFDNTARSASPLVVPAEGGQPREVLRVADPETLGAFVAWTPDGKSLLFRKFTAGDVGPATSAESERRGGPGAQHQPRRASRSRHDWRRFRRSRDRTVGAGELSCEIEYEEVVRKGLVRAPKLMRGGGPAEGA